MHHLDFERVRAIARKSLWILFFSMFIGAADSLLAQPQDVDHLVSVRYSGLRFNRRTRTFDSTGILTNTSNTPISAPIRLVIESIDPPSVSLANPSGNVGGLPFIDIPNSDGVLEPAERSRPFVLKFRNPVRVRFTFEASVFGVIPSPHTPPVRDAGPDQTVPVGGTVQLDGSGSHDADGDSLTFLWDIVALPPGSAAFLSDATAVAPTFVADVAGTYVLELIVNDGTTDGAPDTVEVIAGNSAPVADAGPDQTVL